MTATGTITLGHVEIMQVSERSGRSLSDGDLSLNTPRDLEMTRVDLGQVMAFGGQG
jgi:hypothetical protein